MSNRLCRCAIRGSINNDEYFYVKNIARPGETISSYRYESRVGGKGANQAIAITRAGGIADFYGTIGKDGLWVKKKVVEFGLDDSGIIVSDDPTGRALIQIAEGGENSIILFPGANHSQLHETVRIEHDSEHNFPESTHLLLQNEIHFQSTLYALNNSRNTTTIYNPSPLPTADQIKEFPWHKVNWLIVNEGEARDLYNALCGSAEQRSEPQSPRHLIAFLCSQPPLAVTNVICTLGEHGVLVFIHAFHKSKLTHDGLSLWHFPAAELQGTVRDTTGAGDCFTGYFVCGLMGFGPDAEIGKDVWEHDIEKVIKLCIQAAGMCVERQGTIDSIPTRAEVEARMCI